jgi:sortase A
MNQRTSLRWIEGALLVVGVAIAVWCGVRLVEGRYVSKLPVPSPPHAAAPTQPGDANANTGAPSPIPSISPGGWVARLDFPSIQFSATVLEGSDDATLSRGAGHIEETAFPGQVGNIGIAGHRDTTFRPVRNLHVGDLLDLTTADHLYRYRISKTFIVNPDDVYVLDPGERPMVTLVTCYPFEFIGHAPKRYIVQAELVAEEIRTAGPDAAPRAAAKAGG